MPAVRPTHILLERLTNQGEAFALYHYLDSKGFAVKLEESPLRGMMGEIPFLETATKLFLLEPEREAEARKTLAEFRSEPQGIRGTVWKCKDCGETHDPEFAACWNCGRMRDSGP